MTPSNYAEFPGIGEVRAPTTNERHPNDRDSERKKGRRAQRTADMVVYCSAHPRLSDWGVFIFVLEPNGFGRIFGPYPSRAEQNEEIILTIIFSLFGLLAPVLFLRKKLRKPIGTENYQLYAGQSKRASLGIMVAGIIITIVASTLAVYADAHVIRDLPTYVVSLLASTGDDISLRGIFRLASGQIILGFLYPGSLINHVSDPLFLFCAKTDLRSGPLFILYE